MNAAQRRAQLLSAAGQGCYYTFAASSNVTRRVMGNGVVSYATFDRTDRMLSLRYATSGGAGLAYFDYGRDVAGRILRIQREATAGYAIYYAYDNIDRLEAEVWRKTSDNSQVYGFWYSYDAANNRLQQRRETTAGVTWDSTYYQYAADNSLVRRQVATPPSTVVDTYYGYDANGALTQVLEGANATYFGYGANQLVTRILPPAEAATYFSYDGRLNRYYIDKAGTQTYYLWDGLNQLEERDGSGTLLARYTQGNYRQYGIGSVVEIERHVGAATYYQYGLGDHRGTFYKITDQNQNVQLDYTLDAFGRQLAAPGGSNPAVPNDLIYQTNWLTIQIGGRWYGISKYRLYDFELGVFLQRDPLVSAVKLAQSTGVGGFGNFSNTIFVQEIVVNSFGVPESKINHFNLYSFVWLNPINNYDPTGLDVKFSVAKVELVPDNSPDYRLLWRVDGLDVDTWYAQQNDQVVILGIRTEKNEDILLPAYSYKVIDRFKTFKGLGDEQNERVQKIFGVKNFLGTTWVDNQEALWGPVAKNAAERDKRTFKCLCYVFAKSDNILYKISEPVYTKEEIKQFGADGIPPSGLAALTRNKKNVFQANKGVSVDDKKYLGTAEIQSEIGKFSYVYEYLKTKDECKGFKGVKQESIWEALFFIKPSVLDGFWGSKEKLPKLETK